MNEKYRLDLITATGQDRYNAARRLQHEIDKSTCGIGLLQNLREGEKIFKASLKEQTNTVFETNILTSKGYRVYLDPNHGKDTSPMQRSRYLWSNKSSDYFDRLLTLPTRHDIEIGSDFEFMMKLHHKLRSNSDIGLVDTIYMIPSESELPTDDVKGYSARCKRRVATDASSANESFSLHDLADKVSLNASNRTDSGDEQKFLHFTRLFSVFKYSTDAFSLSKVSAIASVALFWLCSF